MRKWNVEPWTTRQWVKEDEIYQRDLKWWKHRKLDFCKEMQMMESSLNLLKGKGQVHLWVFRPPKCQLADVIIQMLSDILTRCFVHVICTFFTL